MALLGPKLQMTNISKAVLIIRNPGEDDEEVILRFDEGWHRFTLGKYFSLIDNEPKLDDKEKKKAFLWLGYFYKSFV
jgi:hypothetical protein